MSKRSEKLRSELTSKVWDFLESKGITKLNAADVDEGCSPIVAFDPTDEEDHFTLDRLVVDKKYGHIIVEGSNTYSNDEWKLYDMPLECVEEILEWLEDNEDIIDDLEDEDED